MVDESTRSVAATLARSATGHQESPMHDDCNTVPELRHIPLSQLRPHPQNPRLAIREDVVESIIAQLQETGVFSEMHAPIVRPVAGHYEIASGHHRYEAAKRIKLECIPCWVKPMTDEEAFMLLVLGNSQGELSPLEIGIHALEAIQEGDGGRGKIGGLREYARLIGKAQSNVSLYRQAAIVLQFIKTDTSMYQFLDKAQHLAAIHKADRELWPLLVKRMLAGKWSVKDTEDMVGLIVSTLEAAPSWWTLNKLDVTNQIITDKTRARKLKTIFTEATRITESLTTATIYNHIKTDETAAINGRDMYILHPQAETYNQREHFIRRVINFVGIPSVTELQAWQRHILEYCHALSDNSVKYSPVLSDDELRERERRQEEIRRLELRERYTPKIRVGDAHTELQMLPRDSVDLIVLDPPYNVGKADWDTTLAPREYAGEYKAVFLECQRVLKPNGSLYLFGVNRMLGYLQMVLDDIGMVARDWITWDTIQGAGGGLWTNRQEGILYYSKTENTYEDPEAVKLERHEEHVREYKGKEWRFKSPSNIWRFLRVDDSSHERTEHPTQKPVELIERIIKANCPEDGLIVDPYIGSGTTGVAAMKNRRQSIGFDVSQEYAALAQERCSRVEIGA